MKTDYKGVEIEISDETPNMSVMSESVEHEHVEHEHVEHEHFPSHAGLKIAGKNVHLVELTDGTYKSHEFPYTKGKSKLEVAKNLIDYVPEYGGKAYNRNE